MSTDGARVYPHHTLHAVGIPKALRTVHGGCYAPTSALDPRYGFPPSLSPCPYGLPTPAL